MLNKTSAHLILQHDGDLKIFLESESFNVDVKARERKEPDMPLESKGMFSGLSLSVGSGTKFVEHDDVSQVNGCKVLYPRLTVRSGSLIGVYIWTH